MTELCVRRRLEVSPCFVDFFWIYATPAALRLKIAVEKRLQVLGCLEGEAAPMGMTEADRARAQTNESYFAEEGVLGAFRDVSSVSVFHGERDGVVTETSRFN